MFTRAHVTSYVRHSIDRFLYTVRSVHVTRSALCVLYVRDGHLGRNLSVPSSRALFPC